LREGQIDRHTDGQKDLRMDGWTDGQTISWGGRWLDGWVEAYVDSNFYLHSYPLLTLGLMMNLEESIFVIIFVKKVCIFITNIFQLTVLVVIILLIKYITYLLTPWGRVLLENLTSKLCS